VDATAVEVREAAGEAVNRANRLKAIGNGIVPHVASIFLGAIADVLAAESA